MAKTCSANTAIVTMETIQSGNIILFYMKYPSKYLSLFQCFSENKIRIRNVFLILISVFKADICNKIAVVIDFLGSNAKLNNASLYAYLIQFLFLLDTMLDH